VALTLTEGASDQIRKLIEAEGDPTLYLRVNLRGGGCAGLKWDVFLDNAPIKDNDHTFDAPSGIRMVVNEVCLTYVDGTEIDYVQKSLSGGFKFNNPNMQASCGCGSSFTVKADEEENNEE